MEIEVKDTNMLNEDDLITSWILLVSIILQIL
jgi:hypothetical protein